MRAPRKTPPPKVPGQRQARSTARRKRPPVEPRIPPTQAAIYRQLDVPIEDWGKPSGAIIAFAHTLIVPAGPYIGKPLRLRVFQMEFFRDVYNPMRNGKRKRKEAILSIGRRGGKTLTAAVMVLVHLAGPMHRMNSTLVSAATTREQASLVFRFVADIIRLNPSLRHRLKIIDSLKRIIHRTDFSVYRAIAAEAGASFGQGIDLCIYDEMAQAKNRALYDALKTSQGSQIDPLMVVISTQAPADTHLLSELIDYGLKIRRGELKDDAFTVHLYAAKEGCALDDEKEWYRANPALGDFRDLDDFREKVRQALNMPSLEASIRNLYLNQRVQAKAPFFTPNVWRLGDEAITEALFHQPERPVFGGLDLSATTDLSALVWAVEDDDGNVHLKPHVWTPQDTLYERAANDRAPYPAWVLEGHMHAVPGAVLEYDFIAEDMARDAATMPRMGRIAYDPWRIAILKQSFERLGISLPISEMGQGFKAISPAIDEFERLALMGKLRHGGHPILRWCISNAVVIKSPEGNRKLDKSKAFGRIDVAQAAVMAIGAMKVQTETLFDWSAMIG